MLFRYRGKLHKIIKADGPERIEAEWWLQDGQHRDYYCVEDEDGLRFARQQKILCQGRGSAANSTVCYCLGITSVAPTKFDLLFSGKTTLIKIILGKLETETVHRANNRSVYIDQDYSLIDNKLKVYEQVQQFNTSALQEHEIKIRLTRSYLQKKIGINLAVL